MPHFRCVTLGSFKTALCHISSTSFLQLHHLTSQAGFNVKMILILFDNHNAKSSSDK